MGIDQSRHNVDSMAARGPDRYFEVADIVQGIINSVIAHAVCGKSLGRQFDDIIGKKLECKQALSARVDDQRRLSHPCVEDAHAFPRVFPEKPDADVEHRPADQIDSFEPRFIEFRGDLFHHRRGHPSRPQTLVAVTDGNVDQTNFSAHAGPFSPFATQARFRSSACECG